MTYQLTNDERTALAWQLLDVDGWIAHAEQQPNGEQAIRNKITVCTERMLAAVDKRSRAERDADSEATMQPTKLQLELAQARMRAQIVADLAAARELGLREAEAFLTAEAAKLEATKQ